MCVRACVCACVDKLRAGLILNDAKGAIDAAKLRSLQERGAGARLESMPTSGKFAINKNEFHIAASLRVGQPMPFNSCVTHCSSGREMDDDGYHLLTCKLRGVPVREHNDLVAKW